MITTAKRLNTIEEYYFSSKLREVRQLAAEANPLLIWELKSRFTAVASGNCAIVDYAR
jgi:hypothetical protein